MRSSAMAMSWTNSRGPAQGAAAQRVAEELMTDFGGDARALRVEVASKGDIIAMVQLAGDAWGTVN